MKFRSLVFFIGIFMSLTSMAKTLNIGAIPDQDPEKVARLNKLLGDYLAESLKIKVKFVPVINYGAAVTAFKVGDLDLVWFGGLTGVQARNFVKGAKSIVQREIDKNFHSVFIANTKANLKSLNSIEELAQLKGKKFTFGSESSTSGRLMPQYFLSQANLKLTDFSGRPGFSGSHDKTIKLVEAGTYEVGVLNEQVWQSRLKSNNFDPEKVKVIWRTPAYFDYHWVLHPNATEKFGAKFENNLKKAFFALNTKNKSDQAILDLFGAKKFIETKDSNYSSIEKIGISLGKVIKR